MVRVAGLYPTCVTLVEVTAFICIVLLSLAPVPRAAERDTEKSPHYVVAAQARMFRRSRRKFRLHSDGAGEPPGRTCPGTSSRGRPAGHTGSFRSAGSTARGTSRTGSRAP